VYQLIGRVHPPGFAQGNFGPCPIPQVSQTHRATPFTEWRQGGLQFLDKAIGRALFIQLEDQLFGEVFPCLDR
jgi:hypothetical protein